MEQLPAIGQAVAKSMGVTVAELKELSSSGQITTDVIIKALEGLAQQKVPNIDAYKQFQAALSDLSTTIGTQLLPALTPFVQFSNTLLGIFSKMPQPLQAIVAGVVALGAGFAVLAPAIPGIVLAFKGLAALKIGATLAGWAAVIPMIGTALSSLLPILAAVFTGPVGWIALAVAAGVALYAFRDQIGEVFANIGGILADGAKAFYSTFIEPTVAGFATVVEFVNKNFAEPIQKVITQLIKMIGDAFKNVFELITRPFEAAFTAVRGIVNNILNGIGNAIRSVVQAINRVIAGANQALALLRMPQIRFLPSPSLPRFAKGGVVASPTIAMVGEGGEPEYIIPQSKMAHAAANYLGGARGSSVIPAFANGGVVGPGAAAGGASGGVANTTVQITTGPVLQQDGKNYVTVGDLERALQDFGSQIFRNSRSYGGRRYQGAN